MTKLGDDAFSGSYLMLTIDLPKVTEVGDNAFQLTELKNISLPNLTKLGVNAFSKGGNLEKVMLGIPTIDMLGNLTKVQELELSQVKTIADYEKGLSPLSQLKGVAKLSMSNLQKAGNYAFYQTDIQSINAPKAITLGDYAFYQDKKLMNVALIFKKK
ncbi:leucine-rich repeat domain-containing protein [Enterococcus faecalis]|nr:leucine-rich repeat domain-containing protein [Enterococcus faecalis]EGO8194625.1 leucine-rich repeat domain-containing protein [Enterococcus faecalis]EGO8225665.1 leucine-rich repeat domain-containing protein [Enterococcus faecalis]EGO8485636.1 leucine-rich repeat domain-containing protein [Enterococcus faecalis]EGO8526625.1 leucine-rich repeat domain-containing protein [Enterococcus faecalis]